MTKPYPSVSRSSWAASGFLLLIVIVAGALRAYRLGEFSLWNAEAFGLWCARQDWTDILTFIPTWEFHPPLFTAILKLWRRAFGETEVALRSLSVFFSCATVPLIFLTARIVGNRLGKPSIAYGAALLFALSPLQLEYAQEARYPATETFFIALALTGAVWLVSNLRAASLPLLAWRERNAWRPRLAWATFIVGSATSLWLHNVSALFLVALVFALPPVIAASSARRSLALNAALAGLVVIAVWSPFLPALVGQASSVRSQWAPVPFDWTLYGPALDVLFGISYAPFWASIPVTLFAVYGFIKLLQGGGVREGVLLASVAGTPLVLLVLVTLITGKNVVIYRTVIWVCVAYYVLVSVGVNSLPTRKLQILAMVLLSTLFLSGSLTYFARHEKEPWNEIAWLIDTHSGADAAVFILPNTGTQAFDYYAEGLESNLRSVGLPKPFPAVDLDNPYPYDIATGPGFLASDIPHLVKHLDRHAQVWFVVWRETLFDPDGLVVQTLQDHYPLIESLQVWEGIKVYRFGE